MRGLVKRHAGLSKLALILLAALLLHTVGLGLYNALGRYEFTPVFIGVRAAFVWDDGQRIALVLDEKQYVREHLLELPNVYKRGLGIPVSSIEDQIETDEHGHLFIGFHGEYPRCVDPGLGGLHLVHAN